MSRCFLNYVYVDTIFPLIPIKTEDDGWMWFKRVIRIVDNRPLVYMGLKEEIFYFKNVKNFKQKMRKIGVNI